MNKIVQILGPTGIGKSEIAVKISRAFNGEVISADSVQIYKGFNIGSSKISDEEKCGIPHHLIDVLDPSEQFNVNRFLEFSVEIIRKISDSGKLPIVCGGTALYLRAMMKGIFEENKQKRISRDKLKQIEEKYGKKYMWERLKRLDNNYAKKIGKNDKKRIIRGLEIYYNNRVIPSKISSVTSSPFGKFKFIRIGLKLPRELIYERINCRVDRMVEDGLIDEVKLLRKRNGNECPPFKAIGYREMNQVLDKLMDIETAIEMIKQHSRNFAKRQMSWFNNEKDIIWFDPRNENEVMDFIKISLNDKT